MEERYGWDNYKNAGLAELKRIKSSMFFSGEDPLIALIESYILFYEEDRNLQSNISWTTFYPGSFEQTARDKAQKSLRELALIKKDKGKLTEKKAALDMATKVVLQKAGTNTKLKEELEKPARDKTSRNIKRLRRHLEDFYNTEEGKQSEYRIHFVSKERDYRLGIRQAEALKAELKSSEIIKYQEKKYFAIKYRPILFKGINLLISGPIIAVLFFVAALLPIAAFIIHSSRYFYPSILLFAVMVAVALIKISLIRLQEKGFAALIGKYFLKLSNQSISMASYSGECLVCPGVVELKYSLIGWKGYLGKCRENPDMHTFTFDHITLSGNKR